MKALYLIVSTLLLTLVTAEAGLFSVDSGYIKRATRDGNKLWIVFNGNWIMSTANGVWTSQTPHNYICIERPDKLPLSDWNSLCEMTRDLIGKQCSMITDCGFYMIRGNIPVTFGASNYFSLVELKSFSSDLSNGLPLHCGFDL